MKTAKFVEMLPHRMLTLMRLSKKDNNKKRNNRKKDEKLKKPRKKIGN